MPVYEFYCRQCNTVYRFFSRSINTEKIPLCPGCRNAGLRRMVSLFSTVSRRAEGQAGEDAPPLDEAKMEKAMAMLMKEADGMNEDDPRQAAALMRKLSEATGLTMGPGMEEAIHRLEQGDDPEQVEEEMGDLLEGGEEPFSPAGGAKKRSRSPMPAIDETLYEF